MRNMTYRTWDDAGLWAILGIAFVGALVLL